LHHVVKTYESQLQIFREVTIDAAILDDPASAPETIDRVLRNVVRRKRPGYLEIPRDRVYAEVAAPSGRLALRSRRLLAGHGSHPRASPHPTKAQVSLKTRCAAGHGWKR